MKKQICLDFKKRKDETIIKIFGYDFEVFSKQKPAWWCCTFINDVDREHPITIVNNISQIQEFYKNNKDAIFCGYNSRMYDQFIFKGLLCGMDFGKINDDLISGIKGYKLIPNAKKYTLYNYDCMLKDKSLKQLEGFGGYKIKETSVPFDKEEPLTEKEIKEIVEYNKYDVLQLLSILDSTRGDFEAQLDMISMFDMGMEMFNKTKAQLSATILGAVSQHTLDDEFEITIPKNLKMPPKYQYIIDWYKNSQNKSYKVPLKTEVKSNSVRQLLTTIGDVPCIYGYGGLHGSKDNEIFEGIILTADVASLYPSLMINENFTSRKLKHPEDFKNMRDRRLVLKKAKDKRQKPLKIAINSAYGILKDRNSPCYDPLQSNNVCISGQLYLTELAARLENYCEILQINTDGIYLKVDKESDIDVVQTIAKDWETRTKLQLEWDVYKHGKLVQKDVNNYVLIDMDTKHYKCKGAYVKKLSPIDNDLPILNRALINYFVYDIPIEKTINESNNLIDFQKIIKLTALYKGVVYGEGKRVKINGKDKIMVENGIPLQEKVHRVFASNRQEDKGIYKIKIEKGQKSYEKVANTPDKCFIDNDDIRNKSVPNYLDRQYYIDMANDRIQQFLTKEDKKVDNTPNILFNCMCNSKTFYEFLKNCKENNITKKILKDYITANCCNIYGKTKKLLIYYSYFNDLYNKKTVTTKKLNKYNESIKNIILQNSKRSDSGKTYKLDSEKILQLIFKIIPNENIDVYSIIEKQLDIFNEVRYIDKTLNDNYWFVLNWRNVIAPNVILYNLKNGKIEYRKIRKDVFNVLPLQDGDIIKILNSEIVYGQKIVGKNEIGINILDIDINKKYNVINQYELMYRHYTKNTKLLTEMDDVD